MIKHLAIKGKSITQHVFVVLVILSSLMSLNVQAYGGSRPLTTGATTEWVDYRARTEIHVGIDNVGFALPFDNFHSFLALLLNDNYRHHLHFFLQQEKFRSIKANFLHLTLSIPFQKDEDHLARL